MYILTYFVDTCIINVIKLTFCTYGTGIEPILPYLSLAVHHCSSSLKSIVKISPFLKLKSSFS